MEEISFPCKTCGRVLKVGADKAGRKAKCKCGAAVVIPMAGKPAAAAVAEAATQQAPPPPPPLPPKPADDDDDGGTYGVLDREGPSADEEDLKRAKAKTGEALHDDLDEEDDEDDEDDEGSDEDPEIAKAEEARRQRLREMISLRKAPINPEQWNKVRLGLLIVGVGACLSGVAWALHCALAFMAFQAPMEYAYAVSTQLIVPDQVVVAGVPVQLDKPRFMVALLTGADSVEVGLWLLRFSYIFTLMALLVSGAGYAVCIAVPPRFGTRGLAIACVSVAAVNFLIILIFELLPLTGASGYILVPFVTPEVAMTEANMFRIDPIHITWSGAPFWESLGGVILHMMVMSELVLFSMFLRASALSLKDDVLEQTSETLIRLALGTAFIRMAYLLLSNTGTSDVLLTLLQLVYVLGMGFYTGTIIYFAMTVFGSRTRIARKLKGL